MSTLITHKDKMVAEAFAERDLTFYNEQAGKDYNHIFDAISDFIPTVRFQTRQKIAGRIYQSHKKGKKFEVTSQLIGNNGTNCFQIFTISLSAHAPTYINWDSAKIAILKLIQSELKESDVNSPSGS